MFPLPAMIVMIPITDLFIRHPLTPDTHRADIQQRGLRIPPHPRIPITMDIKTTDLNTRVIMDMAIMVIDTQATIGITGPGIKGHYYCH